MVLTRAKVVQTDDRGCTCTRDGKHGKQRRDDRWTRAVWSVKVVRNSATAGDPGRALPASAKPLAREKRERMVRKACTETFLGRDIAVCCRPIIAHPFFACIINLSGCCLCLDCSRLNS